LAGIKGLGDKIGGKSTKGVTRPRGHTVNSYREAAIHPRKSRGMGEAFFNISQSAVGTSL
jgi:hypothetical protein